MSTSTSPSALPRSRRCARCSHARLPRILRDDSWACNFVLRNAAGRELDVHSFELDAAGNNALGVPYRAEHLTGASTIRGRPVPCIAPDWIVRFHTGYPLAEKD
jgi:lincosamide nucleotidyltransferase A/C/D/E